MDPVTLAAAITGLGGLLLVATLYPEWFDALPKVLLWGLLIVLVSAVVYECESRSIIQRIIARPGQATAQAILNDIDADVRSVNWLQWQLPAFIAYLGALLAIGVVGRRKRPKQNVRRYVVPQRR